MSADDGPCRYGGDEFVVVRPDASGEVICRRAQLLCAQAYGFHIHGERHTLEAVTLPLGVAVFPEDGSTSAAGLRAADAAL